MKNLNRVLISILDSVRPMSLKWTSESDIRGTLWRSWCWEVPETKHDSSKLLFLSLLSPSSMFMFYDQQACHFIYHYWFNGIKSLFRCIIILGVVFALYRSLKLAFIFFIAQPCDWWTCRDTSTNHTSATPATHQSGPTRCSYSIRHP